MIILFGGGDAGGIQILPNGVVKPIPPLDPTLRASLKNVSKLAASGQGAGDDATRAQLAVIATEASAGVISQVASLVGVEAGDSSLIYLDWDDGFFCGNVPIPVPPVPLRGFMGGELTAAGAL
jgi:hypothetical protein